MRPKVSQMQLDFEWEVPLEYRRGAATRLAGIDVLYEFKWGELFQDERAQFRNGQCLANRIREDCPQDKIPTLLLTDRDDEAERSFETPTRYVVVLNLPRYLEAANADAAVSYFAERLTSGITRVSQLTELTDARPDELQAFLSLQLNAKHISAWASGSPERIDQLREIAGVVDETTPATKVSEVIKALRTLEALDPEILTAVAEAIGPETDRDARLELLRALTSDPGGRRDASEILGQRTSERLADARAATADYIALLEDPTSNETDLQQFIENNLWLLGLDYAKMRPRQPLPRGVMDFILERFDGFHDLLELKSPQDPIVEAPDAAEAPPPANRYSLSPTLAVALAQVHVYRDTLTAHEQVSNQLFGLPHTRDPRVIIVIGKAASLPDHRGRVLRELNRSLHRVEIVPYDILAKRANQVLDNVERYLVAAEEGT